MPEAFDPYYRWLGIPPAEQPPNAYRLLGVQLFEEDSGVIEMAADQRMMHLRNFQTGDHSQASQALLNEVAAARVLLLNPEKRARYDQGLRQQWTSAPRKGRGRKVPWEFSAGIAVAAMLLVCAVALLLWRGGGRGEDRQPQVASAPEPAPPAASPGQTQTVPMEPPSSHQATAAPPPSVQGVPPMPPFMMPPMAAPQSSSPPWPSPQPETASTPAAPAGGGGSPFAAGGPTLQPVPQNASLSDVVEKVEPATVQIETGTKIGSGFVADPSGLIVTSYHVIEGASRANVIFSDNSSRAVVAVAVDKTRDLAALRVAGGPRLPAMALRGDLPRKGERVFSMGAPRGFSGTVSEGIVSHVRTALDLEQILGADAYRGLGYDEQTTWIQTTTPVSPGNSGGPLVDMAGRVVGVNTWVRTDAQNLCFAVSSPDVARFLSGAGSQYRPLAVLAQQPPPPPSAAQTVSSRAGLPSPSDVTEDWKIDLPSGSELSASALKIPPGWQQTMFPAKSALYVTKYSGGAIQGIFSYDGGRLHGPSAELYESGQLCWLTSYYSSDRDGKLRYWNAARQWLLYAEYTRGRKDGLVCVFKEGMPWWLQQWEKDQLVNEYLVAWAGQTPSLTSKANLEGEEAARVFADAHRTLADLEAAIGQAETAAKRDLIEWYREEDQRIKQERAARVGVQKRQDMLDRVHARGAAASSALQNQARAALSRSGW